MRNTVIFAETATDKNIINNPRSVIYDEITYNNDPNNIRRNGIISGEVMSTVLVNTTMRQNSIFAYFFTNVINDILTNYCGIDGTALQSAYRTITNESTAKSFADRYIGTVPSAPITPNAVIPYLKQIDFILDGQQQIVESLSALNMVDTADGNTTKTIETRFEEFAQSVEQSGSLVTGVVNNYVAQSGNTINDTFTNYESGNTNSVAWLNNRLTSFLTKTTWTINVDQIYATNNTQIYNMTVVQPIVLSYSKIGNLVICTALNTGKVQADVIPFDITEFTLSSSSGSVFPPSYRPKNANTFESPRSYFPGYGSYTYLQTTNDVYSWPGVTLRMGTDSSVISVRTSRILHGLSGGILSNFTFAFYYVTEYTES